MTELRVRALQAADADAARALVSRQFGATSYEARLLEQLELALSGDDPECRALVAGDDVREIMLFGSIAGAEGVLKIHALAGDDVSSLRALVLDVMSTRARLVICELADDAPFAVTGQLLRGLGFEEEGRVADFFRDDVALVILTWRGV